MFVKNTKTNMKITKATIILAHPFLVIIGVEMLHSESTLNSYLQHLFETSAHGCHETKYKFKNFYLMLDKKENDINAKTNDNEKNEMIGRVIDFFFFFCL